MNHMYYLLSKGTNLEAIYICENGNYIDRPAVKTGVYPMGVLLSRSIGLLTLWAETDFNLFKQEDLINKAFEKFPGKESSFSRVAENDIYANAIFKSFLKGQGYIDSDKTFQKSVKLLRMLIRYINLCQKDVYYCYSEYLKKLLNYYKYDLPQFLSFTTEQLNSTDISSEDGIKNFFMKTIQNKVTFDPPIINKSKRLFAIPGIHNEPTQLGTLQLPLDVFEIFDIVDLIAISLNCIFDNHFVIGKCPYCGDLFVTHNRKIKYCHSSFKSKNGCYEYNKLEKQLLRENSKESNKKHKNIRTAMSNKLGTSDIRYLNFLSKSQDFRNKIKTRDSTEEEYIFWMQQYWEDIKMKYKHNKKA